MDKTKTSIDHRELLRKSFDKIRVNNPFAEDIVCRWDGFPHVIPAKGYAIKERYIAEKYLRETAKRFLVQKNDRLRNEENERRIAKGVGKMNRWQEEQTFESDLYANWPQKQIQAIKELGLYGGIAEEYGMDRVPLDAPAVQPIDPNTSLIEQLDRPEMSAGQLSHDKTVGEEPLTLEQAQEIEHPTLNITPTESVPHFTTPETATASTADVTSGGTMPSLIDDLEGKSQPQLRAIAKEKGLPTEKTDKKADLIAQIQAA